MKALPPGKMISRSAAFGGSLAVLMLAGQNLSAAPGTSLGGGAVVVSLIDPSASGFARPDFSSAAPAPLPPYWNTTNASADVGGWTLGASGATFLYGLPTGFPPSYPILLGLRAETRIGGGALHFDTNRAGLGSLVSLSLVPLTWSAVTTINTAGWEPGQYYYEFDFTYLGGVLSLNTALANNLNVKITQGASVLVDTGTWGGLLPDLLTLDLGGLVVGNSVSDSRIGFNYGGGGPLTLEITASQALSTDILGVISSNPVYSFQNSEFVYAPIPEPSIAGLIAGACVVGGFRRRRQRASV